MKETMDSSFLNPITFNENPELAALRILKTTLDVVELALRGSYPDSCECSERRPTEQEAYAIAILYQIDALAAMLKEYEESIRRLREWQDRERSKEDIPF